MQPLRCRRTAEPSQKLLAAQDECLKHPRKAGLFAGSCACAMYLDCVKNCLWVANLGDSRAVLGNVDACGWVETVELTVDHSAGTGAERHRVKEEHPHDAAVVSEVWDEFLEVYVYLVKCAPAPSSRRLLPAFVPLAILTSALANVQEHLHVYEVHR